MKEESEEIHLPEDTERMAHGQIQKINSGLMQLGESLNLSFANIENGLQTNIARKERNIIIQQGVPLKKESSMGQPQPNPILAHRILKR
jgi:hypothetical protein